MKKRMGTLGPGEACAFKICSSAEGADLLAPLRTIPCLSVCLVVSDLFPENKFPAVKYKKGGSTSTRNPHQPTRLRKEGGGLNITVKFSRNTFVPCSHQVERPLKTSTSSLELMWSCRGILRSTPTPTCASSPSEAPRSRWRWPGN